MSEANKDRAARPATGFASGGGADAKRIRPHAGAVPLSADEIIRGTFDSASDAMIVSTATRRILSANAAARALFGFSEVQFAGQSARTLYGPEEDWSSIEAGLRSSGHVATLVTMRHASGALFDADVSATAAFDAHRRIRGVVETIRAVTSPAGVTAAPHIHAPDTTAVRLARGLAHDFNNLLAIITGNVQLAGRHAAGTPAERYLRDAEVACDVAARLTRRVMSFAEDRRLAADEVSIAELIKSQTPLLKRAAGDTIKLTCKIAGRIPDIVTDRSALENALLNLVINARDALPAGGKILLSARFARADADHPAPFGLAAGDYVCIAVCDTGTGMTPRVQARAFDPFFTTKDPGRGTGLGLAAVYGFAKQSGGTAVIESAPGAGTTVTLALPVTPQALPKRC